MTRSEGASAVEFALLLPVLVAIFFGVTQFGVIFMQDLAVSNAARQGARLGVQPGNECGDIRAALAATDSRIVFSGPNFNARVNVWLVRGEAPPTLISVCRTIDPPSALPCVDPVLDVPVQGDRLKVEVEFDDAQLVIPRVWNNPIVLVRDAVFRCELAP